MKIQPCIAENINNNKSQKSNKNTNFKAGLGDIVLNTAGSSMQWIQDKGFLASFLIQDGLGMTLPRTYAGFLRDKEVTGKYNMQEGFEVLGREGLTGPCMMAVAPIMFALAALWGKSTGINSQFIKRYGNSLKSFLSRPNFDKSLLNNAEKLKKEFMSTNIRDMLEKTVGKENFGDEAVKYILEQIHNYQNIPSGAKKGKVRAEAMNNIVKYINDLKFKTSSELNMLDRVRLGHDKVVKEFQTKDAIEALMKFSDDAITKNKNLANLNAEAAENIANAAFAKRMITNVGTMAMTLGVMSYLPKIYAKSNVSPSERIAIEMKNAANEKTNTNASKENKPEENKEVAQEVAFKGAKPNSSWLSKLGKIFSEKSTGKLASELEYNGHNFTNTLMASLSLFGLLAPRGMRAYSRAPKKEDGKKDLSELWEILIRDISSSLTVVFAVPMITRAFVSAYEKKSGFVLMNKDRSKTGIKKVLDIINPYSSSHVLSNNEIRSLYDNVTTREKMVNFCEYISKNGGDIEKIISKSENIKSLKLDLPNLANLTREQKNKKLTEFFKNLGKDGKIDKSKVDETIKKLMQGTGATKNSNKIMSFARGLNSIPAVLVTFLISPYLLGWFIPRLTYARTRKQQEKALTENQQKDVAKA